MIFNFCLENKSILPVFRSDLGTELRSFDVCYDTGCVLTRFYMTESKVKSRFPEIVRLDRTVDSRNADGDVTPTTLYVIPDFVLTDDEGKKLHITDFYCSIMGRSFPGIDVLLSGSISYNARTIITPYRDEDVVGRRLIIDTFEERKDTLSMFAKTSNGIITSFPTYIQSML